MGCGSCRISQMDTQFFRTCKNNNYSVSQCNSLLTNQDRQFWTQQLYQNNLPETQFTPDIVTYKHPCYNQIKKDILRTFPNLQYFGNKINCTRFQNLLQKFSLYYPKIGYTQGLNFVAGYIIACGFDDQKSFENLVRLMFHQKILAIGLYQDQFPLNRFYCEVFWNLLIKKMPKVAQKIKKANVPDQIWIFQWFISFFLYSFPPQFVKGFWDLIIFKKQMGIILVALGILKCLKNDILSYQQLDQFQFFQYFENTKSMKFCDEKIQIKKVLNYANTITKSQIDNAISSTKCVNNIYRKYFTSTPIQQRQIYIKMEKNFKYQRNCYQVNPDPRRYCRNVDTITYLQNMFMQKLKLYQSEFKRSNNASIFNMSNFSIALSNPPQYNNRFQISENLAFNLGAKFTQSKVIDQNQINNYKKPNKSGFKPFDQIIKQTKSSLIMKPTIPSNVKGTRQNPDFSKKKTSNQ